MLHLLTLLAIYIAIAVILIRVKSVKSEKGLMILGGSIVVAAVFTAMTLVGWGIWTLVQAQL